MRQCINCRGVWDELETVPKVRECPHCEEKFDGWKNGRKCPYCGRVFSRKLHSYGCPDCLEKTEESTEESLKRLYETTS